MDEKPRMNALSRGYYLLMRLLTREAGPLSEGERLDEAWRQMLWGENPMIRSGRRLFGRIPSSPRCKSCNAPFRWPGAPIMRLIGRGRSRLNPTFCQICLDHMPAGGAEVELTMLFADVRGSTPLAEGMTALEYSRIINRFYREATDVLVRTDALVDRLVGDQVIGLYVPGYAGSAHAAKALEAGRMLLQATGHGQPGGPWLPVGAGVHTGTAWVGRVGKDGVYDVAVLGDAANVTARLASNAAAGEIVLSQEAVAAAGLEDRRLEARRLEVKGKSEPVEVRVIRVGAGQQAPAVGRH